MTAFWLFSSSDYKSSGCIPEDLTLCINALNIDLYYIPRKQKNAKKCWAGIAVLYLVEAASAHARWNAAQISARSDLVFIGANVHEP